jgi:ribosome modulation factor
MNVKINPAEVASLKGVDRFADLYQFRFNRGRTEAEAGFLASQCPYTHLGGTLPWLDGWCDYYKGKLK